MITRLKLKKRINELLSESDLNALSERQLREKLIAEFGEEDVKKHTRAIKNAVENFLVEGDDEGDNEEGSDGGGTKRKGDALKQHDWKRSKVENGEYMLTLGPKKRLSVRKFKGKLLVDLRETYEDKQSGETRPGKAGIALQREQWAALKAALPQLAAAQEAGNTAMAPVKIGTMRKAAVTEFKGKVGVQVREYYETPEGEHRPGMKGLNLDAQAMAVLKDHEQEIESHVERLGGQAGRTSGAGELPAPASGTGSQAATGGASTSAAPAAGAAPPPTPAAAAPSGPAEGQGEGAKAGEIKLGPLRRVTVSEFAGKPNVGIRDWYEKDGELKPGKTGISLQVPDWQAMCSAVGNIDRALEQLDVQYALPLSGKRKVFISNFEGKVSVAVREMYIKDEQEHPGPRGINLNPEQWQLLKAGIPNIAAALQ